jgi:DNA-directed RNA polymerase specialized sigma24 family protein
VRHAVISRCKVVDSIRLLAYDPSVVDEERRAIERRERARGSLRALYLGELADIGRRRQEALAEADRQLDRLLHLVLNVGDAGIGIAEIARMANVSRPTVYALLPRARDNVRDMRLAVLQLTLDGATAREISKAVRCPRDEVEALLLDFEQRRWVVQKHPGTGRREDPVWLLDTGGVDAIEEWDFDRSIQEYLRL